MSCSQNRLMLNIVAMTFAPVITVAQREEKLSGLIMKVIKQGLEGLVLKDTKVRELLLLHEVHS